MRLDLKFLPLCNHRMPHIILLMTLQLELQALLQWHLYGDHSFPTLPIHLTHTNILNITAPQNLRKSHWNKTQKSSSETPKSTPLQSNLLPPAQAFLLWAPNPPKLIAIFSHYTRIVQWNLENFTSRYQMAEFMGSIRVGMMVALKPSLVRLAGEGWRVMTGGDGKWSVSFIFVFVDWEMFRRPGY